MSSRVLLCSFALFATVAAGAQVSTARQKTGSTQQAAAASGHVWHMKKVNITTQVTNYNTNGNMQILGMTMLVPSDWTFQGAAWSTPKLDCTFTEGRFNFEAQSPDHTMGLRVIALGTSFWSTNRMALQQVDQTNRGQFSAINCPIHQPLSFEQAITEAVPRVIPQGRVEGQVEPVVGLSDQLAASVQQANQQMRGQSRLTADSGRLRVSGVMNGQPIEAWLIALRTIRTDPAPGGGINQLMDVPLFAIMYAPAGQLDSSEKMLGAMLDSVQINPDWVAYNADFVSRLIQIRQRAMNQVASIYAQMAQDNANAAAQQARIRAGTQQYSNQVHANVSANRAEALDHSSQQFALHMGDQAIYKDPATGQNVQMSNQYGHAWANTTGNTNEYILTDSPSFDPNGQVGSGSWTQMQQVQ